MASCPACTAPLREASRFCPDCGAALGSDDTPTGTAPRPGPARSGPRPTPRTPSGAQRTTAVSGSAAGRFAPGDLLAERYRIVGLLGKGGMGEVYRADDLKLGQPVALKFLPEAVAQDPERLDRFYNEVRVARQVSHPNVCRVYDTAEAAGQHFLSMEFVDGEDLASLLRRIGRLPNDKALEIAQKLCAGLAAAHERGVLHRDLKPENVMIDGRGRVRITDFGLAGAAESIVGADVRSGTPAYMSPEQLAGREVSTRSDVYALGLVLYELFTGKRAFDGKSFVELLRKHQDQPAPRPSEVVPDIDPAVERVILRCLEKEPLRRPASALAVSAALPGGDPLAAAIAAGETPSPEMVAAAGEEGALRPALVWALLAFCALGAAACLAVVATHTALRYQPMEKPPVVLADRARELIARLGYPDTPADSAFGYAVDFSYLLHTEANDRSPGRWAPLATGRPPVLQFWYRQSPRALVSTALSGRVFQANPPQDISGMTGVHFDARGRLIGFYAVPPQLEEPAERVEPPDWQPLFDAAKLDAARFTSVPSRWTPPFTSDVRAAWEGSYEERPDIAARIEAAGYRGRPVMFRLVHRWSSPERMQAFRPTREQLIANTTGTVLFITVVFASGVLAWRNLKAGRSDRKGALRLTAAMFVLELVAWALWASHVADFNTELALLRRGAGSALLIAAVLGLLYLALEPYVRRAWPDSLISWTRLLSGRVGDPLVGSHLLSGVGYGVLSALLVIATHVFFAWTQEPPPRPIFANLDALIGVADTAYVLLARASISVGVSLFLALLFVGVKYVLRKEGLAAVVVLAVISVPEALGSGVKPALAIPAVMVYGSTWVFALVRQGLLCLIANILIVGLLLNLPFTVDLSRWYAQPTLVVAAFIAAVCAYAARASLKAPR
jgi:serine/threonine-protein kinase